MPSLILFVCSSVFLLCCMQKFLLRTANPCKTGQMNNPRLFVFLSVCVRMRACVCVCVCVFACMCVRVSICLSLSVQEDAEQGAQSPLRNEPFW